MPKIVILGPCPSFLHSQGRWLLFQEPFGAIEDFDSHNHFHTCSLTCSTGHKLTWTLLRCRFYGVWAWGFILLWWVQDPRPLPWFYNTCGIQNSVSCCTSPYNPHGKQDTLGQCGQSDLDTIWSHHCKCGTSSSCPLFPFWDHWCLGPQESLSHRCSPKSLHTQSSGPKC